jgi:uncharacterized protein YgiM (DUF1202 family)
MSKTVVLFLCLALVSQACLTVGGTSATYPPEIVITPLPTLTAAPIGAEIYCAEVLADTALHVRAERDYKGRVLGWLEHGDIVRVVDMSDSNWWRIEREGLSGYARSMYLVSIPCVENRGKSERAE